MSYKHALLALLTSAPLLAVQTITSVTTTDVDTTVTNTIRSATTPAAPIYSVSTTYSGIETRINTLSTATLTYIPFATATATARRAGATNNTTTIWNHNNLTGTVANGTARTVAGEYSNSMDTVFSTNNLRSGTENLFVNDGGSAANSQNNVERMDFVFNTVGGFNPIADLGISIFERGLGGTASGANGGFKVAAITTVASNGLHTYAPTIVTIATNSYSGAGNAGIGFSSRYDVYTGPVGSNLNTLFNDNIGPQGLAGVLVGLNEFGTTLKILGYSILPLDFAGTTAASISDWANATFYPQNSGFSNDVDLVASGAQVVSLIPEPSTYAALVGVGMIGLVTLRRRHHRR